MTQETKLPSIRDWFDGSAPPPSATTAQPARGGGDRASAVGDTLAGAAAKAGSNSSAASSQVDLASGLVSAAPSSGTNTDRDPGSAPSTADSSLHSHGHRLDKPTSQPFVFAAPPSTTTQQQHFRPRRNSFDPLYSHHHPPRFDYGPQGSMHLHPPVRPTPYGPPIPPSLDYPGSASSSSSYLHHDRDDSGFHSGESRRRSQDDGVVLSQGRAKRARSTYSRSPPSTSAGIVTLPGGLGMSAASQIDQGESAVAEGYADHPPTASHGRRRATSMASAEDYRLAHAPPPGWESPPQQHPHPSTLTAGPWPPPPPSQQAYYTSDPAARGGYTPYPRPGYDGPGGEPDMTALSISERERRGSGHGPPEMAPPPGAGPSGAQGGAGYYSAVPPGYAVYGRPVAVPVLHPYHQHHQDEYAHHHGGPASYPPRGGGYSYPPPPPPGYHPGAGYYAPGPPHPPPPGSRGGYPSSASSAQQQQQRQMEMDEDEEARPSTGGGSRRPSQQQNGSPVLRQQPGMDEANAPGGIGGNMRYSCPHCTKRFARPSSLKIHLHSHTGEKPFQCPTCGRAFSVQSNLRRHVKVHKNQLDAISQGVRGASSATAQSTSGAGSSQLQQSLSQQSQMTRDYGAFGLGAAHAPPASSSRPKKNKPAAAVAKGSSASNSSKSTSNSPSTTSQKRASPSSSSSYAVVKTEPGQLPSSQKAHKGPMGKLKAPEMRHRESIIDAMVELKSGRGGSGSSGEMEPGDSAEQQQDVEMGDEEADGERDYSDGEEGEEEEDDEEEEGEEDASGEEEDDEVDELSSGAGARSGSANGLNGSQGSATASRSPVLPLLKQEVET